MILKKKKLGSKGKIQLFQYLTKHFDKMKIQKDPPQSLVSIPIFFFFYCVVFLLQRKKRTVDLQPTCSATKTVVEEKPEGRHQDNLQAQGEQERAPT